MSALSDWELWACANRIIQDHGEDAVVVAHMRADKLAEDEDEEGAQVWRAIVRRVNQLKALPLADAVRH